MTELEKLRAGLEYCYDDEEVDALKERAIIWCQKFNALDPLDFDGQRAVLKENLGSMGEHVWIAKETLIKALPRQGESEKTMEFQHVKPKA